MIRFLAFLLIGLFSINFVYAHNQTNFIDSAVIDIACKSGESVPLHYYNLAYLEKQLYFSNKTKHDSVISKKLHLDIPVEVQLRIFSKNRAYRQSFLVRPNEKIEFELNGYLLNEKNGKKLIPQSYLDLYDDFALTKPYFKFTTDDFKKFYFNSERIYRNNVRKADSLHTSRLIDDSTKRYFHYVSLIDYYYRMLAPVRDINTYKKDLYYFLKEKVKTIKLFIADFNYYKTDDITIILRGLVKFDSIYQKLNIEKMDTFANYIFLNKYHQYSWPLIYDKLITYKDKSSLDVVNALSITQRHLNNAMITVMIDSIKREYTDRNVSHPETINLINAKGQTTSFKQILTESRGKLLVIDLWATWCIPCREQAPAFNQSRGRFAVQSVRFINISMDDDSSNQTWLNHIKQDKSYRPEDQFRLVNPKKSHFTKFYNVGSIPRYLVLGRNNKMINENFYLPTEKEFSLTISSLIKAN